ncbi:MAG: class I SAM-dependent methyltransferase [Chitinispirillaceae bacterium]|nr:class I SAM-dependent methyltransferase [Chitinispirillaceae bacterium]
MEPGQITQNYYDYLKQIHHFLLPRTYVEIGYRKGESLCLASPVTLTLGIDPNPLVQFPANSRIKTYTMTSDDFFRDCDLRRELGGGDLDLAFIDGMHLFEFVLRDFINLERYATRQTVILLHDCLPLDDITSRRERTTNVWTGDVWKILHCFLKYRPDLTIAVLEDAHPSGLALVSGLDPENTVLRDREQEILDGYLPLGYSYHVSNLQSIHSLAGDVFDAVRRHRFAA